MLTHSRAYPSFGFAKTSSTRFPVGEPRPGEMGGALTNENTRPPSFDRLSRKQVWWLHVVDQSTNTTPDDPACASSTGFIPLPAKGAPSAGLEIKLRVRVNTSKATARALPLFDA